MTEIQFPCPLCGRLIQCDASYAGTQINCPACARAFVVPAMQGSGVPAVPPSAPARARPWRTILIAAAAVVLLAALITAGWLGYLRIPNFKTVPHLIGWWKLDDGSGTVARDSSHAFKGNDGTLVGDPCCGSGGMFVSSEKFVEEHGGRVGDIAVYGQESNYTTWKLARMNLAIHGIDANLGPRNADSFRQDLHPDLKADFILANPPFNMSDWGGENLRKDVRWKFGMPPVNNANYAWIQHSIHHLSPVEKGGGLYAKV